jgi:hypothetical protein
MSTFDWPEAVRTIPTAINSKNVIVGRYQGADRVPHGFIRTTDGTLTALDHPDGVKGTSVANINDKGEIIGTFIDANGQHHGFIRSANGQFKNFDLKNSTATYAIGIDDNGLIVGDYTDAGGYSHGYLRTSSKRARADEVIAHQRISPASVAGPTPVVPCAVEGTASLCRHLPARLSPATISK